MDFNRLGDRGFLRPFAVAALALTLLESAALVGGIAGALSGSDQVIVVEMTDADYLARLAAKLRSRARDRS